MQLSKLVLLLGFVASVTHIAACSEIASVDRSKVGQTSGGAGSSGGRGGTSSAGTGGDSTEEDSGVVEGEDDAGASE